MLKHSSRVGAVVRSFGLGVLALAVLVGLTVSAQQQPAQPVTQIEIVPKQPTINETQIKIVPEKPTINDEITVELSGTFPNACAPDSAEAQVEENQVTIRATNASEFCDEGTETTWSLSVPVGKKLGAGPYRVLVLFGMSKEAPEFLLGMARFDVVGKRTSMSTDQAGQASLVPFTILPVVQTLDGGTSVPLGALEAINLNSSKSNLQRERLPLPATVAVPKGDVVSMGVKNYNDSKSNCCYSVRVAAPAGTLTVPITESDQTFVIELEQTALPDLAVRIRANVRRYTEMEQVFCDITVIKTVSNLGQGPGGVVAMAYNYNDSKPNIMRYGMGSGESATHVNMLIRVRPGSYLLEAEVQSRSVKESNTANNKAREVAICR
jgi:hypothetical protein